MLFRHISFFSCLFHEVERTVRKKIKTVDNCDHISPQENKDVKSVLSVKALS